MDRQFELENRLPQEDWKNYSRSLPLVALSGEGYPEQYLGRDIAGSRPSRLRLYLVGGAIGAVMLFHPFIAESLSEANMLLGMSVAIAVGLEVHTGGKFTMKLLEKLDYRKRILNPWS